MSQETSSRVYRRNPKVVSRLIFDELVLLPTTVRLTDLPKLFTLNETAAFIWNCMDGTRSVAQIRDAVVGHFETEAEAAEQDLVRLVGELESAGLIE